jgi:hypothetical protein
MASRRKYKSPQGYRDGGRVPDDAAPMPEVSADVTPLPASPDAHDAVKRALEATQRAEELQREARQAQPTPEQIIDSWSGLSDHKRSFPKAHPNLAFDQFDRQAMAFHYQAALRDGIPDDTAEMNARLLAGVRQEH